LLLTGQQGGAAPYVGLPRLMCRLAAAFRGVRRVIILVTARAVRRACRGLANCGVPHEVLRFLGLLFIPLFPTEVLRFLGLHDVPHPLFTQAK